MAKKTVLLTLSELCDEFGLDHSVFNRGDYVNNLVENPENPIPSFYVQGRRLFRAADVDSWAEREIQRQQEKSERE